MQQDLKNLVLHHTKRSIALLRQLMKVVDVLPLKADAARTCPKRLTDLGQVLAPRPVAIHTKCLQRGISNTNIILDHLMDRVRRPGVLPVQACAT